ncbi:MAG: glycosyltransferase [Desulfovibrio sp.]|jgi:hypothetical protein|nr:glycosyltransferase [Desulfovibrio sp.]
MSGAPEKLLVWIGTPFFCREMEKFGWRVAYQPYKPGSFHTAESILELTGGERPDLTLAADASSPPFLLGMETFPWLTAFYSVDAHIHSWHHIYAQGFDICLVSLPDRLPLFTRRILDPSLVWHFPPYARDEFRPPANQPEKEWDLIFVGNVTQEYQSRRAAFLSETAEKFPGLRVFPKGFFPDIYPKSRLILNECSHGELNFRVFEALGMGGCLLTPDIGRTLTDMFRDGEELFTYPAYDSTALAALVGRLLHDAPLREKTAAAGLARIDERHRASHRAEELSRKLHSLMRVDKAKSPVAVRLAKAAEIHHNFLRPLYLHHAESLEADFMREAFLSAAKPRSATQKKQIAK